LRTNFLIATLRTCPPLWQIIFGMIILIGLLINLYSSILTYFFDYSRFVFEPSEQNVAVNSPEFKSALRTAATVLDCASNVDPFNLTHRSRFEYDTLFYSCKAELFGLTYPNDFELVQEECPPTYCLGTFCLHVRH
jgi:hypothetical protein